ncbi:4'-phosphopantetheinyl transferase family protein [Clostridium brassicae]|uniref:4'-phosphopantetheinyl transferase superfamily protein n=1 Tax=Clostridium brassicae TaxID=2999072 RepID=A0ABT4DCX4_9CLOT|nr:4'-phosphopantetheinyl transferase superfamily protein [Clostridium brassicae]MCY6958996.1 4'-phosphopantetheinyl transferase superfamily protein [Clostridium brassicae]
MDIVIVKNLDIIDVKLKKLCEHISCEKRSKANKLLNKNDKIQTIVADIIIRIQLIKHFNIRNESICFNKNIYGKPYVEKIKNFHFNISHSGEYVAVAISKQKVGIDIEKIKNIDYFDIAENFFTNKELKYIMRPNKQESLERFYDIWTLKESYIKFNGKGLSIPLDSFTIFFDDDGSIKAIDNNCCTNNIFNQINILPGYKLSICRLNNERFYIKILNQNEIIDYFLKLIKKENI